MGHHKIISLYCLVQRPIYIVELECLIDFILQKFLNIDFGYLIFCIKYGIWGKKTLPRSLALFRWYEINMKNPRKHCIL